MITGQTPLEEVLEIPGAIRVFENLESNVWVEWAYGLRPSSRVLVLITLTWKIF